MRLIYLLRHDTEDREDLYHNLNDYIRHFKCRWYLSVDLEPSEEAFDPPEDVHKSLMACASISNCLRGIGVKVVGMEA